MPPQLDVLFTSLTSEYSDLLASRRIGGWLAWLSSAFRHSPPLHSPLCISRLRLERSRSLSVRGVFAVCGLARCEKVPREQKAPSSSLGLLSWGNPGSVTSRGECGLTCLARSLPTQPGDPSR